MVGGMERLTNEGIAVRKRCWDWKAGGIGEVELLAGWSVLGDGRI